MIDESKDIVEYSDDIKARNLFDSYASKNSFGNFLKKKYKKIEFRLGDSQEVSFKKISPGKYICFNEVYSAISKNYEIFAIEEYIINLNNSKVRLKRRKITKNTLPYR